MNDRSSNDINWRHIFRSEESTFHGCQNPYKFRICSSKMMKELFPTDQNIQWNDKSSECNKETKKDHVMLDHDIQTNKHKGNNSTEGQ